MSQQTNESRPSAISLLELTVVGIRAYALYLLLSSIFFAVQTVAFFLSKEWKNIPGVSSYSWSLTFLIWAGTALFLLAKSDAVAQFILSGRENTKIEWNVSASDLVWAALTVMGVVFLVSGLQGLVGQGAKWFWAPKDELTGARPHLDWDIAFVTGVAVQFLAGLVLVIGFRRIKGLWLKTREFFSLKDNEPTPPQESPEDLTNKNADTKPGE